jgi:tetratricopeptide (TPR) repeat protein
MKKNIIFAVLLLSIAQVRTNAQDYRDTLPSWLIQLRDAVYEQTLSAEQIYPLYMDALTRSGNEYTDANLLNAYSRCQNYMGMAYLYYQENNKALVCFQNGYDEAERSLAIQETVDGWVLLAANLSQMCIIKSKAWTMTHGLDIEKFSKKALQLEPRNATALFLIATFRANAPWPVNDTARSMAIMHEMLTGSADLQRDDLFNIYLLFAHLCLKEKRKEDTRIWIDKALSVYPANKYARYELESQL